MLQWGGGPFPEDSYKLVPQGEQPCRYRHVGPQGVLLSIHSSELCGEAPFPGCLGVCLWFSQPGRSSGLELRFFSWNVISAQIWRQLNVTGAGTASPERGWMWGGQYLMLDWLGEAGLT